MIRLFYIIFLYKLLYKNDIMLYFSLYKFYIFLYINFLIESIDKENYFL